MGNDITSAQFNFAPDELAYIAQHYIHLDQDQTWTAPAGAAYTLHKDTKNQTRVSVDLIAQSGWRANTPTVPMARPCRDMRRSMPASSKSSILGSGRGPNFASMF
jgi:hypothetical protein